MKHMERRLQLRLLQQNDFALYFSLFGNEEVMKYAMLQCFVDEKALQPYFDKVLRHEFPGKQIYDYVVSLENGTSIGIGELEITSHNAQGGVGELGYFLLPEYWGKGYATQLAQLLCQVGFEQYGLHKLFASCHSDNIHSEKIMQKIGMKKEGQLRKARFKENEWHDELRYCILLEEWQENI